MARRRRAPRRRLDRGGIGTTCVQSDAGPAPGGKAGGVLRVMQREELPQGFAIHETATTSTVWPASPCFNNLIPHQTVYSFARMQEVWLDAR